MSGAAAMNPGSMRGTGVTNRVTADTLQSVEPPVGEHDWQLIVQHRLSRAQAAQSSEGLEGVLGPDTIAGWSPVVCFRCELVHADVAAKSCPGEPGRHGRDGRPMWQVGGVWTVDPWRGGRTTTRRTPVEGSTTRPVEQPRMLDDCPTCPASMLVPRQASTRCTVEGDDAVLCGDCAQLIGDVESLRTAAAS